MYETPTGGYHIAYREEGTDEVKHIEIPGHIVKMASAIGNGKMPNPFAKSEKV